jgi:hypothetical protein
MSKKENSIKIKNSSPGIYLGNYFNDKTKVNLHYCFVEDDIAIWVFKEFPEEILIEIEWTPLVEFNIDKVWQYNNAVSIESENEIELTKNEMQVIYILKNIKMGIKKFIFTVEKNTDLSIIK